MAVIRAPFPAIFAGLRANPSFFTHRRPRNALRVGGSAGRILRMPAPAGRACRKRQRRDCCQAITSLEVRPFTVFVCRCRVARLLYGSMVSPTICPSMAITF